MTSYPNGDVVIVRVRFSTEHIFVDGESLCEAVTWKETRPRPRDRNFVQCNKCLNEFHDPEFQKALG